ncbi:MAG: hypothetical protein HN919_02925 [Verrucomicrobia bacterium]|jgi:hypothetical protein|nr:hypothetical protein [Verrucomicrobiota bacterium]MBT7065229.1 hypothetical protein [Verrucomicrobiota bacterium]MBT7700608.1 hypothetical protein [Verrucomicrobiota bacterium]
MATVILGDLLDRAADFEQRVERCYTAIREASPDNGVRLLTYYLARQGRRQGQGLEGLDPAQKERIRAVEMETHIQFEPSRAFHVIDTPPEALAGITLIDAAIQYDKQLITLYRGILQQPLTDEACDLLKTLLEIEERDIVKLETMMATHYF